MVWLPGLVERHHDIQNPTSPEKLRTLFARLRLGSGDSVLDAGAGTGGPAVLLARETGASVTAVEAYEEYVVAGRDRAAGLPVTFVHGDAAEHPREGESYDAALCLGASFVYGGFGATLDRLAAGVRAGGHVAVGEPYARVPGQSLGGERLPSLGDLFAAATARGLRPVTVVASSTDDWDTYHSLHLLALEDWLDANPGHPEAGEVAAFREESLAYWLAEREAGWAVVAARVP